MPEHTSGRGRVDFALLGAGRRPSFFIEVKGVGRSIEGDRQLFEYAFHEGVPLCVLTDGREWSFYLPSGQGSYDDRRVYRLQLDDREPGESERVLVRYLNRERVKSGAAFEDAQRDYRDLASRREAKDALPKAWSELISEREELLLELVADKAEAISGFRPTLDDVAIFLQQRPAFGNAALPEKREPRQGAPGSALGSNRVGPTLAGQSKTSPEGARRQSGAGRNVTYSIFGKSRTASNANVAFVDILKTLSEQRLEKMPALAKAVQGRSRNHIAPTVSEIYPARPDLARAVEIAPGWLVGLNIANREKMSIIRTACEVFGVSFGIDVIIDLPNAN